MNILPLKPINMLGITILLFLSCTASKRELEIRSISKGITVDENYYYSKSADKEIGKVKYSLRSKAEYDSGRIIRLTIYYPEGDLNYEISDLMDDPDLLSSHGYSNECKVELYKDQLLDYNDSISYPVTKIAQNLFKVKKGKIYFFYQSK